MSSRKAVYLQETDDFIFPAIGKATVELAGIHPFVNDQQAVQQQLQGYVCQEKGPVGTIRQHTNDLLSQLTGMVVEKNGGVKQAVGFQVEVPAQADSAHHRIGIDRKSTRLNSSH